MGELPSLNSEAVAKLRKLAGGKYSQILATFLQEGAEQIEAALAGDRTGNMEAVRRAAHTLRPSAAMFGALELQELTTRIETLAARNQADEVKPLLAELPGAFERLKVLLKQEPAS